MIRLFASDLDDTLLNEMHESDEIIKEALKRITAAGKYFSVVTGRQMRHEQAQEMGFIGRNMYMISLNGALIRDDREQIIFQKALRPSFVLEILERFPDIDWSCNGSRFTYSCNSRQHLMEQIEGRPIASRKKEYLKKYLVKDCFFDQSIEQVASQEILKMNCHLEDKERRRSLNEFLKVHAAEAVNAPYEESSYEITHCEVNKGAAVAWLALSLGISEDETAVYGDSYNDLTMLRRFRNSYATASAVPEARAAAGTCIGHCRDHAVPKHMTETLEREQESKTPPQAAGHQFCP